MRYLPKSPADREGLLKAIGARSIDDLFAPIPAEYRLDRANLPVFLDVRSGEYKKSNHLLATSVVVSF